MTSIFKSPEGRELMLDWYERFANALPFAYETLRVPTSLGATRVLRSGPEHGTPIVVLHGALAGAPHALGQLGELPGRYRTYAIDIAGQSVHAPEARPDVRSDAFGQWVVEVLDGLGLDQVIPFAVSWGGFVALNTAQQVPERLAGLVLVVPAGMVRSPAWLGVRKVGWPMLRYRMGRRSAARRDRAFAGLFSTPDPMWSPFVDDAMHHVKLDFHAPPPLSDEALRRIDVPILVFGAEHDVSFPGRKLLARAESLWQGHVETELLDCKHVPPFNASFRDVWHERLERYLGEHHGLTPEDRVWAGARSKS